jgi:hypothetical protein
MSFRMVISNKPGRKGEAFVLHNDTFVLKVYRVGDAIAFANYLVNLLNADSQVDKLDLSVPTKEQVHE